MWFGRDWTRLMRTLPLAFHPRRAPMRRRSISSVTLASNRSPFSQTIPTNSTHSRNWESRLMLGNQSSFSRTLIPISISMLSRPRWATRWATSIPLSLILLPLLLPLLLPIPITSSPLLPLPNIRTHTPTISISISTRSSTAPSSPSARSPSSALESL